MAKTTKNEKKTGGVFLNFRPNATIREQKTGDGKTFYNVSVPCPQSKSGWGSFGVNPGQVYAATKRDGTVVDGYSSILLGKPEGTRQVSICTKLAKGRAKAAYETITMSNADIAAMVAEDRKAYLAAHKATEEA